MYRDHETVFVKLDPTMWYPSLVTMLTGEHKRVSILLTQPVTIVFSVMWVTMNLVQVVKCSKLASPLEKRTVNLSYSVTW